MLKIWKRLCKEFGIASGLLKDALTKRMSINDNNLNTSSCEFDPKAICACTGCWLSLKIFLFCRCLWLYSLDIFILKSSVSVSNHLTRNVVKKILIK